MIVIATSKGREKWLADCLESLMGCGHSITILYDYSYELGKIRWMYENTTIKQFLFLQDSVVVKDSKWIDELFSHDRPVSLSHNPYFMYMGKYTRDTLAQVDLPDVKTKRDSVRYENEWTQAYARVSNPETLWPLQDTDIFEERHGRLNMVLENDHLTKYKGTWHPGMITDE